jgi:hypothetical protein
LFIVVYPPSSGAWKSTYVVITILVKEMASIQGGIMADSAQLRLQKWIKDGSSPILQASSQPELGFVSSFYQECQQLLSQIWETSRLQLDDASKRQLQESVTRFVLWGSGWSEGRLDSCLDASIGLRNNVTELLSGLAKALLQCKFSPCSAGGHWLITITM